MSKKPCDNHPYQDYSWVQLHEVVVDKEYQLECLSDELNKLCSAESESRRKDELITTLRKEVAEYKKCTQSRDIRYASIEEQFSRCESNLQERTKEFEKLQLELEKRLKSAQSKSGLMQKDISRLSERNEKLEEELKKLKAQNECDVERDASLRRQLAAKKGSLESLQEKTKKILCENQELQKRFESIQGDQERLVASERQLKAEVERLKSHPSEDQLVNKKCEFIEQELLKAKGKESDVAAEMGRLESELLQLCSHISACAQVPKTGTAGNEIDVKSALETLSQIANGYHEAKDEISSLKQELEEERQSKIIIKNDLLHLIQLWTEFQDGVGNNGVAETLASKMQETHSEDEDFNKLLTIMRNTAEILHSKEVEELDNEKSVSDEKTSTIDQIKKCYSTLAGLPAAEDVEDMITNMTSALQSSIQERTKLSETLLESELKHTASLSGAVTALRQDECQRMEELTVKIQREEEAKRNQELSKQREDLEREKQDAILKEKEVIESVCKELDSVKLVLESEKNEMTSLMSELTAMESKLHEAERARTEALAAIDSTERSLECKYSTQIMEHKEQAQQYAVTIVALEEKLAAMTETGDTLQKENQALRNDQESKTATDTAMISEKDQTLQKNTDLIGTLRNQLTLVSVDNSRKDEEAKQLRNRILEINDAIKRKEEEQRQKYCEEISDLQVTMAKQEAVIEQQASEINALAKEVCENTALLDTSSEEQAKTKNHLLQMERTIAEGQNLPVQSARLTDAGHICLKEKHNDIIENQKTALAQLRKRLSELELAKPPIGSHQATLKELSRVRHELAKVKSEGLNSATASIRKQHTENNEVPVPQFLSASMEENKSKELALHQVEDTLHCSERMYKTLVEAIQKGMPDSRDLTTEEVLTQLMASTEQSKKKEIFKARKKFADGVYKTLLKSSSSREIYSHSVPARHLGKDEEDEGVVVKNPEEIIASLEATLSETAEELEQQRRLNQALLRRKNFRESQQMSFKQKPRHTCVSTIN